MNTGAYVQSPQPDDLSRVAPRRLAIYGEGPRGIFAREAFASAGFGEWLTSSGRNHERYWALVDFVDADFDPHDASVDDVECLLASWKKKIDDWVNGIMPECEDDDDEDLSNGELPDENPFQSSYGFDFGVVQRQFREAVDTWSERSGAPNPLTAHQCHDALGAIDAPSLGGVYFLLSMAPHAPGAIKIGWSKENIAHRIASHKTAHPWPLRLIAAITGVGIKVETKHHQRFSHLRIKDAPGDEWFHFRDDLLDYVKSLRAAHPEAAK